MNADILRRLVRAIAEGSQDDLDQLVQTVVESERKVGHTRLADELESILRQPRRPKNGNSTLSGREKPLRELPTSRRGRDVLVTVHPPESLEHHMVLAPAIEERFARIEREYAARERLARFGLRPRKTVLLYGPPGCGKSLGARRLAWNTGLPLVKVKFDALISSYFGESAANLRSVFESVKARPSVLLLDECDFIARSRENSKDVGEASRIVNSLLQLMEEYDAPGLLVATTNIEKSLDRALFRRFDEVFHVPPPGSDEILGLLKTTLSALPVSREVRWEEMAKALLGESAATVVKAAQEAAKASILRCSKVVGREDLRRAVAELRRTEEGEGTTG